MSSPVESIGVLREFPSTKNGTLVTVEQIKLPTFDFTFKEEKREIVKEQSSRQLNKIFDNLISHRRKAQKKSAFTAKKLVTQINQCLKSNVENLAVVEDASMSKMMGLISLANGKELEGICHLLSSHAACLRQQILYRHLKSKLRTNILEEPMVNNLDPKDLDTDRQNLNTNPTSLLSTLSELPSEWYMVQISAEHEHLMEARHRIQPGESMYSLKPMHRIHIIVLPTGKNAVEPMCVTLPKPNANSNYDIRREIETLLNNNKSDLTATYNNNDLYWKMRKNQNDVMRSAISELEYSWLKEWRVLLLADYVEHLDIVKEIHDMVDKLIADSSVKEMTDRTRWLLKKIATGACFLYPYEIERAIKNILPKQTKLAKNLILSIVAKSKVTESLRTAKRKTLILILDEVLDHLSFESILLLKHQPVTRFPSIHIAYALFKQHKSTIKNGYKIIKKSDNLGTFVVNPSLDLMKMEHRIKSFINYWLPKWKGLYGVKPDLEFFKNALTQYNVLMYNGHGSGIQFLRGEEIERMRVLASVLLFGCGSIKLLPVGGRLPAYGISNQYLMGCSPCILGMLWEVTDGDIDKMTAEFMSMWISSSAKRPWADVNLNEWHEGKIKLNNEKTKAKYEPDMLAAVAKSKDVCRQYMTSSAIVVRGLPIKLVD